MRRHQNQQFRLIGLGVILAFFASRLYNILAVPIFTDEAIYIRWTQIFNANIHQFFIPLTDGKQPLFIWLGYPFLKVIADPVLGMRLVSVLAGFMTLLGVYFLTNELFKNKKIALLASLLYMIFPFALVYDKLALYDSLLATFAVWSLYLEVLLVRRRQFYLAVLSAAVLGGALLTKSSAYFYIYLLPFSLLLFDFKAKTARKDLLKWAGLALLATVGAVACYSILRFSPNYHYIADKNAIFVDPIGVWLKHPLARLSSNIGPVTRALVSYTTLPILFMAAIAFVVQRSYFKEKLLLLVWFAAPMTALVLFGNPRYLFPRYILFMTMPLLLLAAVSMAAVYRLIQPKYLAVVVLLVIILPMLQKDYFILTNFAKAPIAEVDRHQLITGYAAGVGVKQTVDYLNEKSKDGPVYVGTEGVFGLMPESLQDYFNKNKNVEVVYYWPITEAIPQSLLDSAKTKPTYMVFYAKCDACSAPGVAPPSWPLKVIFQIERIEKGNYYTFYQVIPQ
jgi:4-amino-4-deoxy-L-arabinose transferase-like glycosyltransferase